MYQSGGIYMKKEFTLFEEAKKSKVLLNGFLSTIIAYLMVLIGPLIGGVMIAVVVTMIAITVKVMDVPLIRLDVLMELLDGNLEILSLLSTVFAILLCFLWVKIIEKRKISSLGLKRDKFFIKFIKGFGIGVLLFSSLVFIMYIFGVINLEQGINVGVKFIPSILIIIPGWIIQSSSEEIISRGWLMHVVGAKYKPIIGLIVSSIVFGLLHIFNPNVNILSMSNLILTGVMFGLYVIYTQDIWGVCGLHAAWNFSQSNIFGFNVSGMEIESGSLFKFSLDGPNILTGGSFGPEASILSTVIMFVVIIILAFKLKRRGAFINDINRK